MLSVTISTVVDTGGLLVFLNFLRVLAEQQQQAAKARASSIIAPTGASTLTRIAPTAGKEVQGLTSAQTSYQLTVSR